MTYRELLIEALSVVCDRINEDLNQKGAKYDYNYEMNDALIGLRSGQAKDELQKKFSNIDDIYFRRGERISSYISANIITSLDANRLEEAMGHYFRSNEDAV